MQSVFFSPKGQLLLNVILQLRSYLFLGNLLSKVGVTVQRENTCQKLINIRSEVGGVSCKMLTLLTYKSGQRRVHLSRALID